ncbi:DUF1254 domain-containing protein [Mycolicibacterium arseniciresistens]|uniref:DUF1254 domain-containing protein n=1 Tax=Mycolicibacterium arseniciresistens TaxID=3062257 RepID=A0ABT8UGK1_9MYCO|nr:DUF1254 domain-containing protein [Mycolicibacterium arseniciresistens]MDO3635995.1 DUF1254 domain-containing protein [Mycolicibacterium arseniciresistens]
MTMTRAELHERSLYRRAVEAAIWGMPAVNYDAMYQALVRDAHGGPNQIVYWSRLLDWKNQTLTPNPDAVYLMPFYDTTDGPVVLEIPPAGEGSITGSVDDAWQCALEDVGPAGIDAGEGGKFLILPPGYQQDPPDGYIALRSSTYSGYAILRSNLGGGTADDIADAVAYGRTVRFYPLEEVGDDPQTTFIDAADVLFDAEIPYDATYFEALDRRVQAEPRLTRDKAMIDICRSIGIVKGQPFAPDPATTEKLTAAMREVRAWVDDRYEQVYETPFYADTRWALPASPALIEASTGNYGNPETYPIDDRAMSYSIAFFSAKRLGTGQFYLMTVRDANGDPLDGSSTYRLTVPARVPVTLYWSATAYNRATHTLIRGVPWASRSSHRPELHSDADGSVELVFGPSPTAGGEGNWIPTRSGEQFEVLFRFYGPTPPLFDKTWTLPDIQLVR